MTRENYTTERKKEYLLMDIVKIPNNGILNGTTRDATNR